MSIVFFYLGNIFCVKKLFTSYTINLEMRNECGHFPESELETSGCEVNKGSEIWMLRGTERIIETFEL